MRGMLCFKEEKRMQQEYLQIGEIVRPQGIRGEVKLRGSGSQGSGAISSNRDTNAGHPSPKSVQGCRDQSLIHPPFIHPVYGTG